MTGEDFGGFAAAPRTGRYGAGMEAISLWELLSCLFSVIGAATVLGKLARRR
jgi:hypothetical protein